MHKGQETLGTSLQIDWSTTCVELVEEPSTSLCQTMIENNLYNILGSSSSSQAGVTYITPADPSMHITTAIYCEQKKTLEKNGVQ